MKPTLNEKFLAYLALFSGLFLSLVAEYYSILGLTAIFSAAVIPVVIMGIALGLGKISATLWLKQNWSIAPWSIRGYLFVAIAVLMLITSMGIFGFLSKAHSDQSLVSGDVQSKIAIYDEKIKTAKENIESVRRQLKQMDAAVDQVMARSQDEKGADKSNAIRKSQQRDRANLAKEIETNQTLISQLNDEAAPIRAEVRKVEAEVGPITYIAAFVYGETSEGILERAVTWVIITLIVVFDPMAVILLLSSQISFQNFREREKEDKFGEWTEDDFEQLAEENFAEGDSPSGPVVDIVSPDTTVTESESDPVEISVPYPNTESEVEEVIEALTSVKEKSMLEQHPYLTKKFEHFENLKPMVMQIKEFEEPVVEDSYLDEPLFVQNEEQKESALWSSTTESISKEEYLAAAAVNSDPTNDAPSHEIIDYIQDIKSGKIRYEDIPPEFIMAVKARI